jgi:hypothetical protein
MNVCFINTLIFVYFRYDFSYFLIYLLNMKQRKKEEDKKVKFAISVDPILFKRMDDELINKSRLIEILLKEYYGNKDL